MQLGRALLKPAAIWLIAGGVLSIAASIIVFIVGKVVSTTFGTLIVIVYFLIGISEISVTRALWRCEIGAWKTIITWLGFSLIGRSAIIYLSSEDLLLVSSVIGGGELAIFVYVLLKKNYFIPPESERVASAMPFETAGLKSVSECPNCKGIIETDWASCPYCGTPIPKICGKCGTEIKEGYSKCIKCGAEVIRSEALTRQIETLRILAEEEGSREVKSSRYAKLGESLLKAGRVEEAVNAFKKAIDLTSFDRKKSHYMVRIAIILENYGKTSEALNILDEAMKLDPEDYVGAKKVKDEILKSQSAETAAAEEKAVST